MEIFGWIICLASSVILSGLTILTSYGSLILTGKLKAECLLPAIPCCIFWFITVQSMPFSIVLN